MEDSQIPFVCFCSIDKEDIQEIFPIYHRFRQLSKKYIKEKAAYELISENGYISDENVGLAIKKAVKHTKTTQKSSTCKIKKFTCFSCFEKCDMSKEHLPFVHKKFNVALCSSCWGFLNGDPSEWTLTDGKNDYCVVSGEGGDIVSCDKCVNSFTTDVLKKWLTKKQFDHLMENDDEPFHCFSCDSSLGHFADFQKKTKEYMSAFDGDEFTVENQSPKRKFNSSSMEMSTPLSKTSDRVKNKNVNYEEMPEYTDVDDPLDMLNGHAESNSTDKPPPSKKQVRDYWQKIIDGGSKKYKNTEIYDKLKKILEE